MTEPNSSVGLRARKRAATERAIEDVALALALEHGYDKVTVEMICDASMVSQRTFFNYFGTKENAVLGMVPAAPSEGDIQAFVQAPGRDVIGDLITLMATATAAKEPDFEQFRARRKLIHQSPDLMTREKERMTAAESRLTQFVMDRFKAQGRAEVDTPDLLDEAQMVVALTVGALHFTMQKWAKSNFKLPSSTLVEDTSALIKRATSGSGEITH